MYYLYLSIFIILSYIIININIKNKIKSKEIEGFYSQRNPSLTFPTPYTYLLRNSPENIYVTNLSIQEIMEFMLTDMKLIYLNPKYDLFKLENRYK